MDVGEAGAGAGEARVDDAELPARLRTAVSRLSRRLQRASTGTALTSTEVSVLFATARRGPLGLSRLAADEGLNPTALSRIVQRLESQGLALRRRDPADGRAATLAVTFAGRGLYEQALAERTSALRSAVERLDERERVTLAAAVPLLERLARDLAAATGRAHRPAGVAPGSAR